MKVAKQQRQRNMIKAFSKIKFLIADKMTVGSLKRKNIFDAYSANLNFLIEQGILTDLQPKFANTYICPICLNHFSETDLKNDSPNPLTLEDCPPKSLGGKANILTCKSCNNTCGHEIDFHLVERMNEKDKSAFIPGTSGKVTVEKDGRKVQGTFEVSEDGTMQMKHSYKNNNPSLLDDFIKTVSPKGEDPIINLNFIKSRVDPKKLQLALLKTGYLLVFEKFGYAFILNTIYDRIRKQLLNPEESIYPLDFWFNIPLPPPHVGVPFVTEKGLESILPMFLLETKVNKRLFATIIPLTTKPVEDVIAEFKARFEKTKSFGVEMDAVNGNVNYLNHLEGINHLLSWIKNVQ